MSRLWKRAARVCAVSRGVAGALRDNFDVPQSKIKVIYNPIDFAAIDASLHGCESAEVARPHIVTVGRLTRAKDHTTLLKAFACVRERIDAYLTIAGAGPLLSQLQQLAGELGIRHEVEFAGRVSNPFPLMARADVFALSSQWEGFGCVLAEAMACGTACVSTNCKHGPNEIIEDGKSGLLVPVSDPEALAQGICRLLEEDELRQSIAEAGRRRVRAMFGLERRVADLEKLLIDVHSERQNAPGSRSA